MEESGPGQMKTVDEQLLKGEAKYFSLNAVLCLLHDFIEN